MPRVTHLQTNFTAGEISPKLYGRVDIARYANGAEKMRDLLPQVYGGAKRRQGSLFVRETKDSTKTSRLIPFVKDGDTAYVLEFGDGYMRVYKDGAVVLSGGLPYEISSPYSDGQLPFVDYTQGADTMFLFHEAVAPQKLVCAGDTSWTLGAVAFVETPYDEPGEFPNETLTAGLAGPVGTSVTLGTGNLSGDVIDNEGLTWDSAGGGRARVAKTGHGRSSGEVVAITGAAPAGYNVSAAVITVDDADHYSYSLPDNPGSSTEDGKSQFYGGGSAFGSSDVGKTIKMNGGILRITSYINANAVIATIKEELLTTVSAPPDTWSIHAPAWSPSRGYPRTGTLHEQRLVAAGSPSFPQTLWGSVVGAYLDFSQGTADDDAFSFTIATDIAHPIRYLASNRALLALSSGCEFTIEGGTERPLAPTNARIRSRSNYGCALVRPVRIRDAELFVQRAGRKVRSFAYSVVNDDWSAPDLSVLAEHLTEGGITNMAWQQEPESIVWLARADGALLSLTLDRDQEVTAWAFHEGFGQPDEDGVITDTVESLTSIPVDGEDQVWMVVRRVINGVAKRYVERLSDTTSLDCAIVATGASSATWGGLAHLNGETVHAVANGIYRGSYTPSGGSVTLSAAATSVNIGLNYLSRLKLLPPEIQTGMGSASGNAMRTSEVTARFYETTGCKVNGKELTFRSTGLSVLDQAPERFTGVKRIENLGFERGESEIEFTQEAPMPFHLLSVTRKFTTNDG